MKYENEMDAVKGWVARMNSIPTALVKRAFPEMGEGDGLELLAGGKLESSCCEAPCSVDEDGEPTCDECGESCDALNMGPKYDYPAAWGTMWTFGESLDETWARENATAIAQCGFVVYESDETGIILGIDGGGYDFFEAHWLKLYRARGLKWHTVDHPEAA